MNTEQGWRRRLTWSYWDIATDFPRTRRLIIGFRVASICIAVPIGAVMFLGFVVSLVTGDAAESVAFGMGVAFVVFGVAFAIWDLRRLRRMPEKS